MDATEKTPADDSPIQPVSSLRTHFERIALQHATSPRGLTTQQIDDRPKHTTEAIDPRGRPEAPSSDPYRRANLGIPRELSNYTKTGQFYREPERPRPEPSAKHPKLSGPARLAVDRETGATRSLGGSLIGADQHGKARIATLPYTLKHADDTETRPPQNTRQPDNNDAETKQSNAASSAVTTNLPEGRRTINDVARYGPSNVHGIGPLTQKNQARPGVAGVTEPHIGHLAPTTSVGHAGCRPSSPFMDWHTSPFSTADSGGSGSESRFRGVPTTNSSQYTSNNGSKLQGRQIESSNSPDANPEQRPHLNEGPGEVSVLQKLESLRNQEKPLEHARLSSGSRTKQTSDPSSNRRKAPPPPPRRPVSTKAAQQATAPAGRVAESVSEPQATQMHESSLPVSCPGHSGDIFPDISRSNRSLPYIQGGARMIQLQEEIKLIEVCEHYICTANHAVRVFDTVTGELIFSISQPERDARISAIAFKAARTAHEEGTVIWAGTESGTLHEINILTRSATDTSESAHERREIAKIHRHQNSMWTIDVNGRLCVWDADSGSGLSNLRKRPSTLRISRGYTCSIIVCDALWVGHGKDINIYKPKNDTSAATVLELPLSQPRLGAITSATVVGVQPDNAYFGHADGKVSVYSVTKYECVSIVSVSSYRITAMMGVGPGLWVSLSSGNICVFDTATTPWKSTKSWIGHRGHSVQSLAIDLGGLWRSGSLKVVSSGSDQCLRCWDGTLRNDWLEQYMVDHEEEFCSFRDITALVMTWNAGATTPSRLKDNSTDQRFFESLVRSAGHPDMLIFGFQELIDLEDKKMTAKTLFKGSKKKDAAEQEHLGHQYRAWRDYLMNMMEAASSPADPYRVLNTASMVGLFSCVFMKSSQHDHIRSMDSGEVKRGMGGLHGNKGAIALRFILDDSSICLVNCHLAAGQSQTSTRNIDIQSILDSELFPSDPECDVQGGSYCCGGDGSMVLDHEICILNGDLNYRIDTMGREAVLKALASNNIGKLLERDQLLVSRRRSPAFVLRAFYESPIQFAPTYKYNVGADIYDTSEKRRVPAWCDRVLYRDSEKCKQTSYLRHDLRISDHRPVTGQFNLKIKRISKKKEALFKDRSLEAQRGARVMLSEITKLQYLRDVLGVPWREARDLI